MHSNHLECVNLDKLLTSLCAGLFTCRKGATMPQIVVRIKSYCLAWWEMQDISNKWQQLLWPSTCSRGRGCVEAPGQDPSGLVDWRARRCPLCLEIPSNIWLIHHTHYFDCQWETISSLFPSLRSGKSYYGAFLLSAQQEQKTAPPLCLHVDINIKEFTVSTTSCMLHVCLTIDRMTWLAMSLR